MLASDSGTDANRWVVVVGSRRNSSGLTCWQKWKSLCHHHQLICPICALICGQWSNSEEKIQCKQLITDQWPRSLGRLPSGPTWSGLGESFRKSVYREVRQVGWAARIVTAASKRSFFFFTYLMAGTAYLAERTATDCQRREQSLGVEQCTVAAQAHQWKWKVAVSEYTSPRTPELPFSAHRKRVLTPG